MWTPLYIAGAATLVATTIVLGVYLRTYWKLRGDRVIRCPENREIAAVVVDARRAGITAILGEPTLRLRDCTRWPQRQDCGQECLSQIEAAPHDCLVRTILTKWYQGKACVYCHRPFDEINWLTTSLLFARPTARPSSGGKSLRKQCRLR
jgi:hypothetical protein